jgi:dipeptidyl-peptidase 4
MKDQPVAVARTTTLAVVFLAGGAIALANMLVQSPRAAAADTAADTAAGASFGVGQPVSPRSGDYARAEQFMPYNSNALLLHVVEEPTWLDGGELWYRTKTAEGFTSFVIDPVEGTKQEVLGEQLPRLARGRTDDDTAGRASQPEIEPSTAVAGPKRACRDAHCLEQSVSDAMRSPDRTQEVFVRDHNLWARDLRSGKETSLTVDGTKDYGYATNNSGRLRNDRAVALWAPDSSRVATFRQDQRGVGDMYLVRTERGHPELEAWKYATPADPVIPTIQRVVIDLNTRRIVPLQMPPDLVRSASWLGLAREQTGELEAQWSSDSSHLAFVSVSRDHKCAWLRVADAVTGAVQTAIEECMPTFYESAPTAQHALDEGGMNWSYLDTSGEVIWYSSRDNWGHLYLYDVTGRLKNRITSGEWNVVRLVKVDERERVIFFSAVGREPDRNPYFEHFYRVGFDGEGLALLTPEEAHHVITMSPSAEYFVDSYSRPDAPPVGVLKDRNGKLIRALETADISALRRIGWKPPTPFVVKARDGATDLYGLMFKPSLLDERRRYPIVNAIYSAPIYGSVAPNRDSPQWGAFSATYGALGDAQSLAELGFIVVMIDGMGTPLRSRAFHEFTYANYGDATLPDQVSGMRQLAQRYPWIDIERAGIYGASHGGYATARAMFVYPDFFKVGVAISGNHDPMSYMDEYTEKFMGLLRFMADGTSNYDPHSNMSLAKNLRGRLLLIHGTMDENVSQHHTLLLVQALIEANRDFDLLMLPNQTHALNLGTTGRYMVRRYWDYFVRHLLGADPPRQYGMSVSQEQSAQWLSTDASARKHKGS